MPLLLRMTYIDLSGFMVKDVGPEELYLPNANSAEDINNKVIADALEDELEEYRPDSFSIKWKIISSVN